MFSSCFLSILSCFVAESYGAKEGEVLGKFNKAKFSENSGIDKRPFEVIDLSQEEEITDANKQIVDTLFGINLSSVGGSKENDRIQSLPGQPKALVAHLWLMEQWKSLDHLEYIVIKTLYNNNFSWNEGHYVPQLAHTILYHNKKANQTIINLKGIAIGNAVINDETDNLGIKQSRQCNLASGKADHDTADIEFITSTGLCATMEISQPSPSRLRDYYVQAYFNTPEVQEAMHANVTKLNHDWEPCSDILGSWKDSPSTVIPLLQEFMANGLRVWIYRWKGTCNFYQYSIAKMKLPTKTEWYPWYLNGEVGGYSQVYQGDLTFVTVRGAGHQVPSYQPERSLSMINTSFLAIPSQKVVHHSGHLPLWGFNSAQNSEITVV
ncbi:hypothetical protein GH714_033881 [Hevea brasiliensis]|uniref:Carboxypeptidase n=1 Tax=Hevea brasiliensis TaxID=3981 RepID=A0A6A6N9F1_HEVBR|nr:hypothetical protein GH714_033881 [Hevea brasiliensis]